MRRAPTAVCATAAVGLLLTAATTGATAQAADGTGRQRIDRTAPDWVAQARARGQSNGQAADAARSDFRLYLAPRGGVEALKADALARSTPGTPSYGKWRSAADYHAAYDPTPASISAVRGYLTDNGLTVSGVGPGKRYLSVSGTNAAVEKAFATTMGTFTRRGEKVQTNTTDIAVPRALAPLVLGVTGLDTETHRVEPKHVERQVGAGAPPPTLGRNARPCSTFYGQLTASTQADFKTPLPKFRGKTLPYAVCGYTGPQLRSAYEGGSRLDGTGTDVAIVDAYASPTIAKDARRYAVEHGDGGYAKGQLKQRLPRAFTDEDLCDASGWYLEQTLDVEAAHAMAPAAGITYYGAASCDDRDFIDALTKVVDDDRSDIVSNSWSGVEADETTQNVVAYEQVFLQAAEQGISMMFASGDAGDELQRTGLKQTDYPASDPYVTAVGGTADAIGPSASLVFQAGWGTQINPLSPDGSSWTPLGFESGAGGGASSLFNQPAYQTGVVPARYGAARSVPDVALTADPSTGFLIGLTQTFPTGVAYGEITIGGTSLASPLFAGMSALRQQHAHRRLGLQNPAIYRASGTSSYADVKGAPKDVGNVLVAYENGFDASEGLRYAVATFGQDSSLAVRPGYDQVTGVGSPTPAWLTAK